MAAIYQWYVGGVTYELYTTTPYPIEVIEGIELGIAFFGGALRQIDGDEADLAATFLGGEVIQILISGGPWDDAADLAATFLGGVVEDKLVLARAPAEGIELGIALAESDCSMTPV